MSAEVKQYNIIKLVADLIPTFLTSTPFTLSRQFNVQPERCYYYKLQFTQPAAVLPFRGRRSGNCCHFFCFFFLFYTLFLFELIFISLFILCTTPACLQHV